MSIEMGRSCIFQLALYQSLMPSSSYSPSFFLCSNKKDSEHYWKNKKKITAALASQRHENPYETSFCSRRAIFLLGISASPFIQSRASAVDGLVKEEKNVRMLGVEGPQTPENFHKELVHQGEDQPNPFLALLNVTGIIGSGILGALYALAQKEKTDAEATTEALKTKLSKREAAMASLEKNIERMLLNEQEEGAKKIRKAMEEKQSFLNQLTSANCAITGLQKELQSERRLVEELKAEIDKLQTDLRKAREDKVLDSKEKLDSIKVLQERINFLSQEVKDKEDSIRNLRSSLTEKEAECGNLGSINKQAEADVAEENLKIKGLIERVFRIQKELDLKNCVVDDLNGRISSLIAERDETNRRIDALQEDYNDLKLSSEMKAALDAELLANREHMLHQFEEKLKLALNEAVSNRAIVANLTQERDDLKNRLENRSELCEEPEA